jgi:hypothetical protein
VRRDAFVSSDARLKVLTAQLKSAARRARMTCPDEGLVLACGPVEGDSGGPRAWVAPAPLQERQPNNLVGNIQADTTGVARFNNAVDADHAAEVRE